MKWAIRSGLLALFAVLIAGNVKADTLVVYSLMGPGVNVTFDVPEFPTISNASLAATSGIGIIVVPTNITGFPSADSVEFFNSAIGGGFEDIPPSMSDTPVFNMGGGIQLYGSADGIPANAETDPMMLPGIFTLFACTDLACDSVGTAPYTLDASLVSVSTPEASTLLLFAVGLTGLALLRKRYAASEPV
jgi:hypothetical protein